MKFAIDIDNTFIEYGALFKKAAFLENIDISNCEEKEEIKRYVRENHRWPNDWIRIQGRVYGELIHDVVIDEHAIEFVSRTEHQIVFVTHKSETSLCGRYCLRVELLRKFKELGLDGFDIIFFNELNEKVNYLNLNQFDFVIDDLESVLSRLERQGNIYFSSNRLSNNISLNSWVAIKNFFKFFSDDILYVDHLGVNSHKIKFGEKFYFLKTFVDIERMCREKLAWKNNLCEYAEYTHFEDFYMIQNYIEMKDVVDIDSNFIKQYSLIFYRIQKQYVDSDLMATHGVKKESDYIKNLEVRIDNVFDIDKRIIEIFTNLKKRVFDHSLLDLYICTPDFQKKNFSYIDDQLFILDHESIGRDDLVRTFLNAVLHFGHNLTEFELQNMILLFDELNNEGTSFWKRSLRMLDLVSLEWILIGLKNNNVAISIEKLTTMYANYFNGLSYWSWNQKVVSLINDRL